MSSWIKIEHTLPDKPEVFGIARRVGQSRNDIVGRLVKVWSWADRVTASGDGLTITAADIDEIAGTAGFADAMRAEGWLAGRDGSLQIPKFERHNGNSAKARALESEAKRLRRLSDNTSDNTSDDCPIKQAANVGPDERERREENSIRDRTDRPIGADHSPPARSSRSQRDFSSGEEPNREPPLDLTEVDWSQVTAMAESVTRRVPPRSEDDRRAWLRYAVMAQVSFSEAWLIGAAKAVEDANETKRSRQAHFVAVLKSKAKESGMDADTFNAIARRIEIPDDVWQSDVLEVPK